MATPSHHSRGWAGLARGVLTTLLLHTGQQQRRVLAPGFPQVAGSSVLMCSAKAWRERRECPLGSEAAGLEALGPGERAMADVTTGQRPGPNANTPEAWKYRSSQVVQKKIQVLPWYRWANALTGLFSPLVL